MKTKRWILLSILITGLVAFGFGCGGGGSPDPLQDQNPDDQEETEGGTPGSGIDGYEVPVDNEQGETADNTNDDDIDDDGIPNDEDTDADGDGFLGEDDCDDMDPDTFPGAPDKPDYPEYTDSNCDGVDGDKDFAYWVAIDGSDANPGTIDQPFATIQTAISAATADIADIRDIYVAEGQYNEDIFLLNGAGIYGGYGPLDAEGNRPRDIETYESIAKHHQMPFYVMQTDSGQESILEGLTIKAKANNPALMVIDSSPTVRHCNLLGANGNNVSSGAYVISMARDSMPQFFDNDILSAKVGSPQQSGVSAAIYAVSTGGLTVHPTLDSNRISSGIGSRYSIGVNVVAMPGSLASLTAFKNDIRAGFGGLESMAILMGWDAMSDQPMAFSGAEIYKNTLYGGYGSPTCIGASIATSDATVKLTNNFITGGSECEANSMGVFAMYSDIDVIHNTINAGSATFGASGIYIETGVTIDIKNNILAAEGGMYTVGIAEMSASSTVASLLNNLFDISLNALYYIAADAYTIPDIAGVNAQNDIAECADNLHGHALLTDIPNRDYHIESNSLARDAAIVINDVIDDIDGEGRSAEGSPDIGADEFVYE